MPADPACSEISGIVALRNPKSSHSHSSLPPTSVLLNFYTLRLHCQAVGPSATFQSIRALSKRCEHQFKLQSNISILAADELIKEFAGYCTTFQDTAIIASIFMTR